MKTFRDLAESPVGKVGRTKDSEASDHINNTDVAKRFRKIVKELGGKLVAKKLLDGMTISKVSQEDIDNSYLVHPEENIQEADTMSPNKFLRDLGFKLKDEKFEKHGFEIEFFNTKDAKDAYKELTDKGFLDYYNMTSAGKIIGFEDK